MRISIPIIKKKEQLIFLSYIVFLTFSILIHSFYYRYFASFYKLIIVFCLLLLVGQEFINKRLSYKASIWGIILLVVVLFLIFQGHGDLQIAFACVFIYAFSARDIDFKKIGSVTIIVMLLVLVVVILSSLIGIIPNYHTITNERSRYYLGFRYALNAPAFLFNVILLEIYVKGSKIKNSQIVILFIVSFAMYKATNSRLSFYLSVFSLIIAVINKIRKDNFENAKAMPRLLVPVYIICFALSLWLTITYSPSRPWMRALNTFLGNRLAMGQRSLISYGIGLFGVNNLDWVGNGLNMYGEKSTKTYLYVDNLFIQVLQRYGIVFIVFFLLFTTILMYQCYKKKEYLLLILLSFRAFHGLIDDSGLYLHFNTFWILFGSAAFGALKTQKNSPVISGRLMKTRM